MRVENLESHFFVGSFSRRHLRYDRVCMRSGFRYRATAAATRRRSRTDRTTVAARSARYGKAASERAVAHTDTGNRPAIGCISRRRGPHHVLQQSLHHGCGRTRYRDARRRDTHHRQNVLLRSAPQPLRHCRQRDRFCGGQSDRGRSVFRIFRFRPGVLRTGSLGARSLDVRERELRAVI